VNQHTIFAVPTSKPKRPDRHAQFLKEMDQVVPWARLLRLVGPYYAASGNRQPMSLEIERMLRIYFLQQWFDLSDAAAERALCDTQAMRRFCLIDLAEDAVPDENAIQGFRHLLERYRLTETLFTEIREQLEHRRPLLAAVT